MTAKRFRLQFKFWLDVNKPEEYQVAELIDDLKRDGSFTRAVRTGLLLVADLWRGNLDVLLALFPWVEDAFFERFQARQAPSDYALREQLARLERLLLEQGNQPITAISAPAAATKGPKPLAVPEVTGPLFDDDDGAQLIVKKAKSDGMSAQNFLDSAFSLIR